MSTLEQDVEKPVEDYATWFEHIADLAPERPAVLAGDRRLTWAELDEQADRLAAHLEARGVRPGSRFGLAARNSPEYVVGLVALFKLAVTPVNVNYRYRAGEVRYVLEAAGAAGAISDPDFADVVTEAGARIVVPVDPEGGFGPEVAATPRLPRRPRENREWLLFTGGTTGYPKAVTGLLAAQLKASCRWMTRLGLDPEGGLESLRRAVAIDPYGPDGAIRLVPPPLMHGTGLYSALGALAAAAPLVLLPGRTTTGADLLEAIARHRVTDMAMVGDVFALRLLDGLDRARDAGTPADISSLAQISSVGAVWSTATKRRLLEYGDLALVDNIAASEGGVYALSTVTRETLDEAGSFVLAPGARLLDEDDNDIPPGSDEVGRLAAPVQSVASYEDDPEKTAGAFKDIDGIRYSIPGDLARLGADGRLTLLGRGNQVINTGGEKVYTDEVELTLRDHPAVLDAVVVGVPDPQWGTVVGAVVSLQPGAAATERELADFVGERLAGYKKPRRLAVVDEVVRLNTGKSDLRWARAQLAPPAPTG